MKKIFSWLWKNVLFLCTLFLLAFIPLYPKLPLLDLKNTWVYVRVEDFLVVFVLAVWIFLLLKRKITLRTPLTLPIMIFWIVGVVATIHGVILIFPQDANVFPNVAFLTFLRHIEYLSLFFVAYAGIKDKKSLSSIISVLSVTFILVCLYGIGQKYLSFPAYLTMNEQFAKGVPITLSQLSRVPSTFAGQYDFAAYLVLMIPILASLIFGFKNWFIKIFFLASVILGFGLLFMTVSRVSFFVLIIALFIVLSLQNKKLVIFSIPIMAILAVLFLSFQSALFSRFGNTVKEVNVLVDARTGTAIGHVNYVPTKNFENRTLNQRRIGDDGSINTEPISENMQSKASPSALFSLKRLPPQVPEISDVNLSTGENLPQGTGYINLSLSPVTKRLGYFFYEKFQSSSSLASPDVFVFHGDFLIKRASAYDLSFTTRFQGEWPHALEGFERNIFIGSGYGSVSLAVDNNYLRMLGETGLFGTIAFFAIFLSFGIYIKKILPNVDSKVTRSFIIGFVAGVIGLALNATLIDVFEASKIAFILWMLVGIVLATLVLYQKEKINLYEELKKATTSSYAIILYLFISTVFIFFPMLDNFFVGDDFTWLRWAAECSKSVSNQCLSPIAITISYFTQANGFFYRPGTELYFLLMHSAFWYNQVAYHAVSILLHFGVAVLFFFLAKKVLRDLPLSVLACFLFLLMSGYSESVFWISSTGYIFNAFFALSSLLLFAVWEEKKNNIYYTFSIISLGIALLFHEVGVIIPFFIILFKLFGEEKLSFSKTFKNFRNLFLFFPVFIYLILRYSAQSHWFSGDYSYNLLKLPFNLVGNLLGYLSLTVLGSASLPSYQVFRNLLKENILIAGVLTLAVVFIAIILGRIALRNMEKTEKRIILFGLLFFVISLIPFLGLGNITSRYSYLASLGFILFFVLVLKKLYIYLQSYGREIAVLSIVLVVSVFSLWHIIQVQQVHSDWSTAGDKSKKFFVSINGLYSDYWSKEPVELHFVNVPIKSGDAWVFPVGLDDAVWFAFENQNIKIYKHKSPKEAFDAGAGTSFLNPVLVFNDDGSLTQAYRPRPKEVVPVGNQ